MKDIGIVGAIALLVAFGWFELLHTHTTANDYIAAASFVLAIGLAIPLRLKEAIGSAREIVPFLDRRGSDRPPKAETPTRED